MTINESVELCTAPRAIGRRYKVPTIMTDQNRDRVVSYYMNINFIFSGMPVFSCVQSKGVLNVYIVTVDFFLNGYRRVVFAGGNDETLISICTFRYIGIKLLNHAQAIWVHCKIATNSPI